MLLPSGDGESLVRLAAIALPWTDGGGVQGGSGDLLPLNTPHNTQLFDLNKAFEIKSLYKHLYLVWLIQLNYLILKFLLCGGSGNFQSLMCTYFSKRKVNLSITKTKWCTVY